VSLAAIVLIVGGEAQGLGTKLGAFRPKLCSRTIAARMEAGSDAMTALWARNKFGWDRPGSTMTFSLPDANGDIGDDNKIIIELVKAPKRRD
jgi:hypothetical protein